MATRMRANGTLEGLPGPIGVKPWIAGSSPILQLATLTRMRRFTSSGEGTDRSGRPADSEFWQAGPTGTSGLENLSHKHCWRPRSDVWRSLLGLRTRNSAMGWGRMFHRLRRRYRVVQLEHLFVEDHAVTSGQFILTHPQRHHHADKLQDGEGGH